jgi:hypothetical protein
MLCQGGAFVTYYGSEEEVKKALNIKDFRSLSKQKIMEFVSLIPNMDKDVAIAIVNQFPAYSEFASAIIEQLCIACDNAIEKNAESQREVIEAYKMILEAQREILQKDDITPEERASVTESMVAIAERIGAEDTKNKEWLKSILRYKYSIVSGAIVLGAVILGVSVKGVKLPSINKQV